jgi:hypothetical protein
VIEAAVDRGVTARPRRDGVAYRSGCDMSGGAHDSATLCVAHDEGETAVLDCLVEILAPFNPTSAVEQMAGFCASMGWMRRSATVTGLAGYQTRSAASM